MFQPNTIVNGRYLILKEIARGGMGIIYLAKDQQFDDEVALKLSSLDVRGKQAFENEAKLLSKLRHTGLPNVRGYFFEGDNQCLVMEFIEGENLDQKVQTIYQKKQSGFALLEVISIVEQLCGIVAYLHSQNPPIIHRDIKPENIKQMNNGQIVLLDFGMAKGQKTQLVGGTPSFAPMEQLIGMPTDKQSDIYSIGATVYNLLSGVMPTPIMMRFKGLIEDPDDALPALAQLNLKLPAKLSGVISQAMRLRAEDRQKSVEEFWKDFEDASLSKNNFAGNDNLQIPKPTFDSSIPTRVLDESPSIPATLPAVTADFLGSRQTDSSEQSKQVSSENFFPNEPRKIVEVVQDNQPNIKPQRSKLPLIIGASALLFLILFGVGGVFALWRTGFFAQEKSNKDEAILGEKKETPIKTNTPLPELKNNVEVSLYLKQGENFRKVGKDYIFKADNQAKYQGDLMYFGVLPDQDGVLYVIWHDFVGNSLSLIYPTKRFPTSLEALKANKEMRFPPIQEIGFDKIQTTERDYNADRIYFVFAPNHDAELIKEVKANLPEEKEISLNEVKIKDILDKLQKIAEQNPSQKETISDNSPIKFANPSEVVVGFIELKSAKKG